jgi:hypothetical protein
MMLESPKSAILTLRCSSRRRLKWKRSGRVVQLGCSVEVKKTREERERG